MQTHSTNQASAAAFAQVGNMVLKAEADKILDIVLAAQRNGALVGGSDARGAAGIDWVGVA